MLISKFDLYKRGWIELVFDDRNKAYGAYQLRQSYAGNMIKAMGITFLTIGLLFGAGIIFKPVPVQITTPTVDTHHVIKLVDAQQKVIEKPKPPTPLKALKAQPAAPPVAMRKFLPLVVGKNVTEKPVEIDELKGAVGPNDSKGEPHVPNVPVEAKPGPPASEAGPVSPGTVYNTGNVEIMPTPVGGNEAWAKFLNKNLRFPAAAQEEGVGGKVYNEEALRVLKLAKAWKPGIQNGQPVRVKFIIPINFQAPENP
jgi:protein TonB